MKIINPNWHPDSPSQLTVAQRQNAKTLLASLEAGSTFTMPSKATTIKSLASLVRHGLAVERNGFYRASDKLKDWRRRGLI